MPLIHSIEIIQKHDSVTPIRSTLVYISRNEREKIHKTKCVKELFRILELEDYLSFRAAINEKLVLL